MKNVLLEKGLLSHTHRKLDQKTPIMQVGIIKSPRVIK